MFETMYLTIIVVMVFVLLGGLILFAIFKLIKNRHEQLVRIATEFNLSFDDVDKVENRLDLPGAQASFQTNVMRGVINGHKIVLFDEFNTGGGMHSVGGNWTVLAIDGNAHRVKHFLFGTQFVPIVYLRRELLAIK